MIFYYNSLIMILLPSIFVLLLLLFWGCYSLYYKKDWSYMFERFFITSILVIIFFMPTIINTCAQFLNCTEIDGDHYITNYLNESCTSNKYLTWNYALILPGFLFFFVIFPGMILIYMIKNKNHLFSKNVLYKVGYMIKGYKSERFYWYIFFSLFIF